MRAKLPRVDLGKLTPEQKAKAEALLYEERDSFSVDDNDIGHIKDPMKIELKDASPVQRGTTPYQNLCTPK
jgi:hypothetical protein